MFDGKLATVGEGPLERDDAIRRAAELLRTADRVDFKRLRSDGPLCTCIDAALASGLRSSRFDRPSPGNVRAIAREARDVPTPQWRRAVLAACAAQRPPADADAAVRAAAKWTQDLFMTPSDISTGRVHRRHDIHWG